jgi:hypothetical protein
MSTDLRGKMENGGNELTVVKNFCPFSGAANSSSIAEISNPAAP